MTVLEFERTPRQLDRVVVRELKWGGLAARQQALSARIQDAAGHCRLRLASATPYCIDDAGDQGEPALLLEHVEALPDLAPASVCEATREMARTLWQIHRVSGADPVWGFLPRRASSTTAVLAEPGGRRWTCRSEKIAFATRSLPRVHGRSRRRRAASRRLLAGEHTVERRAHRVCRRLGRIRGGAIPWLTSRSPDLTCSSRSDAMPESLHTAVSSVRRHRLPGPAVLGSDGRLAPHAEHRSLGRRHCEPPINRPDINEATLRAAHGLFTEEALVRSADQTTGALIPHDASVPPSTARTWPVTMLDASKPDRARRRPARSMRRARRMLRSPARDADCPAWTG